MELIRRYLKCNMHHLEKRIHDVYELAW